MSRTIERFLKYVKIDTQSNGGSGTIPSTMTQHDLASLLAAEMEEMGVSNVIYDKQYCCVYGMIPASEGCENAPAIGFLAHMDTSPDMSGANVNPRIIEHYDGKDIVLNEQENIVMKVADFPELVSFAGKDMIVTDGTTLLGADDKAGIAEIMEMANYFLEHPEVKHGKICIGFSPDEEGAGGIRYFDINTFGADFAYTVDGGELGELEFENFNAASGHLTVYGRNVHPGTAKNKMKNAILMAQEFHNMLPVEQNPMYTSGYEGFFHLDYICGDVEKTTAEYLIRDHHKDLFEEKKRIFVKAAEYLNEKYGEGTVVATVNDSYSNMREMIEPHMHLIDNASRAMKELGVEPIISPIRGGTDGASLSFRGLPCPNLCTGGGNYHGRYEYACVQSMEKVTEILVRIAEIYAAQN